MCHIAINVTHYLSLSITVTQHIGILVKRVGGRLVLILHSSYQPSELLQWPSHDDSISMATKHVYGTLEIVSVVVIIIIF